MIANYRTPLGSFILIFPFDDFLYLKIMPSRNGASVLGTLAAETNNTESAPADVGNCIAFIQPLPFADPGGNTVKVYRHAGILVGYGLRQIPDGLAAPGAIRNRQGFGIHLRGGPFGPLDKRRPFLPGTFSVSPGKSPPVLAALILCRRFTDPSIESVVSVRSETSFLLPGIVVFFPPPERVSPAISAAIAGFSAAAHRIFLPGVNQEAHC